MKEQIVKLFKTTGYLDYIEEESSIKDFVILDKIKELQDKYNVKSKELALYYLLEHVCKSNKYVFKLEDYEGIYLNVNNNWIIKLEENGRDKTFMNLNLLNRLVLNIKL